MRGNSQATVDEKGRVKVPAGFLVELRKFGPKFFVTSEAGEFALIYPMKVWEGIEKKLAALSTHNRAKQKFLDRTNYYGQEVELDGQGRLLLPPVLREAAKLEGTVDVLGNPNALHVWNHVRFAEHLKRNEMTPDDDQVLDTLGI
jgi:MraZ protein